ncbi:prepilin peptidase [Paenibacillus hodogayensis]|uniref:Prepilin peptidase n=1 Tax=Paenibacillus hodogayensis TaxID=279208 RepID=A0ABV5W3Z4_9BACL
MIAGLIVLLAICFYHDCKESKIPNRYTVSGIALGLSYQGWSGGWDGLAHAAIGFAAGFGIMLALYAMRAVGAGDVKLFGAIGAMTGGVFVVNGAFNSIVLAAVIGLVLVAFRGELLHRLRHTFALVFNLLLLRDVKGMLAYKSKAATFPFMYAVLPAMALTSTYCSPLT